MEQRTGRRPSLCNSATGWYFVQVAQFLTVHPELPGQSREASLSPVRLDDSLSSPARIDISGPSGQSPEVLRREALSTDQCFLLLRRNAATIIM
jgi:hypothetical protein